MLKSASTVSLAAASLAAGFTLLGGSAVAATATATATDQGTTTIQDVVVTATKREESLQKVSVSAAVVPGVTLQTKNITSLDDLWQVVPGLHIENTGAGGNTINIRGISSGDGNVAFEEAVATFEDGVYMGRGPMIQSTFLDMDRIEVLKGPQTTYFGNNAIAGALSMVSAKPGDVYSGYARALYGSYGTYAVEGAVGGPISDTFRVRIAANVNGQTGWITNVNTGTLAPNEKNYAGRVTMVWTPIKDFDATLKIEGSNNQILGSDTNLPYQVANCPPTHSPGIVTNGLYRYCTAYLATADQPIGFNSNLNAAQAGQEALLNTDTEELTLNYHWSGLTFTSVTALSEYAQTKHVDNVGAVNDLQYYAIHSVNGATPSANPYTGDGSGTGAIVGQPLMPVPALGGLADQLFTENYRQFSQELRVTSPDGQPIEYMAGLYYQNDVLAGQDDGSSRFQTFQLLQGFAGGLTAAQDASLGLSLTNPNGFELAYNQSEQIYSGFATATWNATSQLKFNAGIRYTSDHKNFVGVVAYGAFPQLYGEPVLYPSALQKLPAIAGIGAPGTYPYARTDNMFMGSAGVQYQVDPDAMLYFTYSHGALAGGFNAGNASIPGPGLLPTFGPETVDSYEIGAKTKWLDDRLVLNADVFREDYAQLQVSGLELVPGSLTGVNVVTVLNAGTAISQGVEVSGQWVVADWLRLTADVTYLDAYYGSFTNAPPTYYQKTLGSSYVNTCTGLKNGSQCLTGQPLDFAPTWTGTAGVEFIAHLPSDFLFTADLDPIFTTSYFNSTGTDDPNFVVPASIRLDGKLTLESPDRRWALDVIGKNMTNAVIIVTYGQSNALGQKEEPQNFSVQLRYKW